MKRIKISLLAILLLLTVLWLAADTLMPKPFTYFSFRVAFMQYSGALAIGLMSVAMLLVLRLKWLELRLDGLDKIYRLHKWLGIAALVVAIIHWWWGKGTKWMVGWGWLEKPAKSGAGETLGIIESWLRSQRGFAESVGEWAFYAAAVLIVLALIKRFPYHWFVKTHKWIAVAYLALVYHAAVLIKVDYWSQPIGGLLAVLLLGGSAAALLTLTGRIGASRKVQGTIAALTEYPALRVLETAVVLENGWRGHAAGQFAFVTSDRNEGAHPYTIASAWNPADRRLVFITKALGDHTSRLREKLKIGMPVTVEGPYGCFDFEDAQPRQIWVGAGIGITPFIARLKQRAATPEAKTIDLFHPTAEFDQAAIDRLKADAEAAGVRLHLLVDGKDGRLNGEHIRAAVPEWQSASIWFCGPPEFGQALRDDFIVRGLLPERFHQELFQMR
ncbi:MAG: ferric reductase-like transmembrane domain-containing protein [Azonexus sp.]|jgi:predicted ferric reductase|uniref:ferredoxin reductase family protein n=1 Tax=Azonexus sp. TaxID=1872668 RepID=UPI00282B934D|nr:ferric reductase-like transmembrane domain-containing protein [Azonexus sp.]MDR0777218.1 ferric reductase-like transmembrane domain-containing protein [Azonexus sp.]